MQSRRKLLMIVLVAVISLMLAGTAFLLVKGFMAFFQAEKMLSGKKGELEFLFSRNPFPSEANLKVERSNLSILDDQLADLLGEVGRGQVQSEEQSPNKFGAQFWDVRKELFARARERGIKVDNSFDFGFAKHMSGVPPAPQDVARLTQQLRIVQRLSLLMFDAGITGLDGLGREEFEVDAKAAGEPAAQPRRSRRGATDTAVSLNTYNPNAGLIPEGELFGRWRFVFRFAAKEDVLLAVLNRLAREPLFVVVSDLVVEGDAGIKQWNTEAAAKTEDGTAAAAAAEVAAAAVPRDLRIVCGRDVPLSARMTLDVYQFRAGRPSPAVRPGEGAK